LEIIATAFVLYSTPIHVKRREKARDPDIGSARSIAEGLDG
jgi:hypothetical protein